MSRGSFPSTSAPLQLAAGESSAFMDIETSGSGRTILVRLTASPTGGRQDGGRPPLLRLRADAGPAVEVREFPEEQAVAGAGDRIAGSATWVRKNIDVYLLRVSLDRPGGGWGVQIVNDDAGTRTFQFMGLGGTKIRCRDEWPGADLVYCGSFPCACTRHDGDLTTACSSCGHRSQPA